MYQTTDQRIRELERENARFRTARDSEIKIMNQLADEHKKVVAERDRFKRLLTAMVESRLNPELYQRALNRAAAALKVQI